MFKVVIPNLLMNFYNHILNAEQYIEFINGCSVLEVTLDNPDAQLLRLPDCGIYYDFVVEIANNTIVELCLGQLPIGDFQFGQGLRKHIYFTEEKPLYTHPTPYMPLNICSNKPFRISFKFKLPDDVLKHKLTYYPFEQQFDYNTLRYSNGQAGLKYYDVPHSCMEGGVCPVCIEEFIECMKKLLDYNRKGWRYHARKSPITFRGHVLNPWKRVFMHLRLVADIRNTQFSDLSKPFCINSDWKSWESICIPDYNWLEYKYPTRVLKALVKLEAFEEQLTPEVREFLHTRAGWFKIREC